MPTIEVVEATGPEDFEAVRALCREFRSWLVERYPDNLALIDAYYPADGYEALLARLPEIHAPPKGVILIAKRDGRTAGCGMIASLPDPEACEMKRLFVHEAARGQGVARALCGGLMEWSRRAGYRVMRLETGPLHHEAQALYPALGFVTRAAYYDADPAWKDHSIYFEREL